MIVLAVAAVAAVRALTPGAVHDTVVESTNTVADAVSVMVSPLTSAVVTPMEKTIDVGACPATSSFTEALVHVSAVSTVAAIVLVVVAVVAVEESPTVNVTIVGVADTAFAARPPTHVIAAVEAAAMPAEPTVSVSVAPLTALPPAAICEAPAVHTGASAPTAHCAWPAESIVTVSPLVSAVPKTIVNTMFVGMTPETSESATAEVKASAVTASTV